ncbi:unnamed protein product [Choristocarpus tenellus]
MDLEVWRRQQFVLGVAPPWMLVEPESTNVRAHHLPILSSLKAIPAQICTAMIFLFVAAWPFTPVLVHWRPWTPESTYAFLGLLVILAWVLMARSHSIYAALLSSLLTLALTGLTAWEYTTEQIRLR